MDKQTTPELKFYKINREFLTFLHDKDEQRNGFSCVPTMNYTVTQKEKFMCGIILKIGDLDYFAPVSSYKKEQRDNVLLFDDDGNTTSSIRLNFMFPAIKGTYKIYDFESEVEERYKSVVRQELHSANEKREIIQKQANKTYYTVRQMINEGRAPNWACNFNYLERLCVEWEKTHQSDKPIFEEKENTKEKLTPKDKEIIERIKKSKSGDVFSELYDGRYEGNKTVADERIMNILAFFTDCNEEQMLRIYKSSRLNVWGTEEKSVKYMARATVATYTNKSVSPTNRRTEYKGK